MRKLRITLASILAAAVVASPLVYFVVDRATETASEADPVRLQGRWELKTVDDGDTNSFLANLRASPYLVIDGSKVAKRKEYAKSSNYPIASMFARSVTLDGEFTLDATKEPKHIDMRFEWKGVIIIEKLLYQLEGGTLSFCKNRKDRTQRPELFRADKQTGIVIEIYERETERRPF